MIDQLGQEIAMMERHLEILQSVIEHEPIGIVKLSDQGGYEHHQTRYSLRILEENGLVEPSQQGAITTDRTETFVNEMEDRLDVIAQRLDAMKFGGSVKSDS